MNAIERALVAQSRVLRTVLVSDPSAVWRSKQTVQSVRFSTSTRHSPQMKLPHRAQATSATLPACHAQGIEPSGPALPTRIGAGPATAMGANHAASKSRPQAPHRDGPLTPPIGSVDV